MAEVSGPISTLPGHSHHVPEGTQCDVHPDRPAVARIQGETDSFGSELNDMCRECLDQYREDMKSWDRSGICEWCKQHKPRLRETRDYEEGLYGRVYEVCDDCRKKRDDEDRAYLDQYGGWDD